MELKDRFKAARRYAGLSQKQLAERSGLTQASLSYIETGSSKKTTCIPQVADICRVSAVWLSDGKGSIVDGIEPERLEESDPAKVATALRRQNLSILLAERFAGSQSAMATFLGKNPTSISRMLLPSGGKNMGESLAREFEIMFGLQRYALDKPFMRLHAEESPSMRQASAPLPPVILDAGLVAVPMLEEVAVGSKSPGTMVRASVAKKVAIPASPLQQANARPDDAACLIISGNGMDPLMPDGTLAAIDQSQKVVKDGQIYALDHSGQIRVKYLYRKPGGGLILRSFKREEHQDEPYSDAEIKEQNIKVLGRVFWYAVTL